MDILLTDKPVIFAFGEHKNRELYRDNYAPTASRFEPIREIFERSEKVYMNNVARLDRIIGSAMKAEIDAEARTAVKSRLFYNLAGDATQKLEEFVRGILK